MPDLSFQIEDAEPELHAAGPILLFKLRVSQANDSPTPIHTIALRCQIRVEPARRTYTTPERERLRDLFGTPERWGQTLRPMLWTHVSLTVPPFRRDGPRQSTGTVYPGLQPGSHQVLRRAGTRRDSAPVPFQWDGLLRGKQRRSASLSDLLGERGQFPLSAVTWRKLMDHYYPNTALLSLQKDIFDRLDSYGRNYGPLTWE